MRKLLLAVLTLTIFLMVPVGFVNAQVDCEKEFPCKENDDDYEGCLNKKVSCLKNNLDAAKAKKTTLESAISIINGSINIQQVKISQTKNEINVLEREITDLDNRISGLSISLDRLSTLLVERVRTQYKREQVDAISFVASSKSLAEFVSQFRYLRLAGQQTAHAMQKADSQRTLYDEQKELKEEKQAEIEAKRAELQSEQNVLVGQRQEQQNLLTVTKNDEQTFQELLRKAEAEVASLQRYTISKGGSSILSGTTKCDDWGCYYNQRDSQWGNNRMGRSSQTIANVGCLVTSAAMVASHYGKNITPAQIAASSFPFEFSTANMRFSWLDSVNGVKVSRERICWSNGCAQSSIDSELSANRPVIVRISAGNSVGTHFVVITKKQDGKYIMKDPYEADGNNIPFTDKHSLSQVTGVDRTTVH